MKVTLANMRSLGCRDLLIHCGNAPRCWHHVRSNADRWPDDVAIVDIERLFVCTECGADVRPDFSEHSHLSDDPHFVAKAGQDNFGDFAAGRFESCRKVSSRAANLRIKPAEFAT